MRKISSDLFEKVVKHDIVTLAAALAFYTALSLAPLMILCLMILSSLKLSMQTQLIIQFRELLGTQAASVLETIILKSSQNTYFSSVADIIGVVTLIVSASAVFAQLQSSLNRIFEFEHKLPDDATWWMQARGFVSRRLLCFGMVLTFIFISIVSLVVSTFLSMLANQQLEFWGNVIHFVSSLVIYALLFAAIFKWMPDCRVSWRAGIRSGLVTALFFVFGKSLIGLYLGQTAMASAYGAAGSLIILLAWVYYSSLILFFGAEITALINKRGKVRIA